MGETVVTTQPVFYLFIAATILLSLGYLWGRRRNKRIFSSALEAMVQVLKPKDQQFTNIGGLTGYHANLIPRKNKYIRRVDATITLLPRQSWLYYPISKLTRRFDRLFMLFTLSPKAAGILREGHLIEDRYSRLPAAWIENADALGHEELEWDGLRFHLYYADEQVRRELEDARERLGACGPLRHLALVPEQDRMWIFMIPRLGTVHRIVDTLNEWFIATIGARVAAEKEAKARLT
ncbi:MAG: hypothetical protein ACLFRR_02955 [Spirochaetaceae bacterium]